MRYCWILTLLSCTALLRADEPRNVPSVADDEIARRGNLVEVVGENRADLTSALAEAMRPPADDSHKWFITVISTQSCSACERLKNDFANSQYLRPFVNVADEDASWAHYNVFRIEDRTQSWRWKSIRFAGFPTVIVQPPRNGTFGDTHTVVLQLTGYDGDAKKLAQKLRLGIGEYVAKFNATRSRTVADSPKGGHRQQPSAEQALGYDPPFSPPPKYEPQIYPQPLPSFEIPPIPSVQPQPTVNAFSLLLSLFGGMLSSGGMTNLLLIILAGLAVIRTFRKATGQKLLLDDESWKTVIDTLKSLVNPSAPKTGP